MRISFNGTSNPYFLNTTSLQRLNYSEDMHNKTRDTGSQNKEIADRVELTAGTFFKSQELEKIKENENADAQRQNDISLREKELSAEQKNELQQLKTRDREVREHEQAHKSTGGQYIMGGASYRYETGPDGKRYAVAGEVKIDISKVMNNLEATIQKARTVQQAATAPANPSAQDRTVASRAKAIEMDARRELAKKKLEKGNETTKRDVEKSDENKKSIEEDGENENTRNAISQEKSIVVQKDVKVILKRKGIANIVRSEENSNKLLDIVY